MHTILVTFQHHLKSTEIKLVPIYSAWGYYWGVFTSSCHFPAGNIIAVLTSLPASKLCLLNYALDKSRVPNYCRNRLWYSSVFSTYRARNHRLHSYLKIPVFWTLNVTDIKKLCMNTVIPSRRNKCAALQTHGKCLGDAVWQSAA